MSLSEKETNDLLLELFSCFTITPNSVEIKGTGNIQKTELIVDILVENTYILEKYQKNGLSEETLKKDLMVFIPDLIRKNQLNFRELKLLIDNKSKTTKQQTHYFIFPINLEVPLRLRHNFKKKYNYGDFEFTWYSDKSFESTSFYSPNIEKDLKGDFPKGLIKSFILIKVKGAENQFSADVSSRDFRVFLGILNLTLFMSLRNRRWSTKQIRTISDVTGTPYFWEYFQRGKKYSRGISEDYPPQKVISLNLSQIGEFDRLTKILIGINKRYDTHDIIKKFLLLYQEGISSPDKVTSFMKFWAILELLTFLPENKADYSLLCNRIKSIYLKDTLILEKKLEFLRLKRNRLIHKQTGIITQNNLNDLRNTGEDLFKTTVKLTSSYKSINRIVFILDHGNKTKKQIKTEMKHLKLILKNKKE